MNTTSRPVYSIRFPMVKERKRYDRRRFRIVPDKTGLSGARSCAASCISSAITYRDSVYNSGRFHRAERLGMRAAALWARVFAGHIDAEDPRIAAALSERGQIIDRLCNAA